MTQLLKELDLFWNRLNSVSIRSDFVDDLRISLPELFLPYDSPRLDHQLWDDLPNQWTDRVNDCRHHGYTISETLIGLLLYLSIRIPIHCIWEMLHVYNRLIQGVGFSHIVEQEDSDEAFCHDDFNTSFLILKGIMVTLLAVIDLLYAIILMSYLPSFIYLMTRYTVTRNHFKVSSPYKQNGKINRHHVLQIKTRSLAQSIGHIKKTFVECIRFAAHPPTIIQLVHQKSEIAVEEIENLLLQNDSPQEKIIYRFNVEQQQTVPKSLFHYIQVAQWLYTTERVDADALISKHQMLLTWANSEDDVMAGEKPLHNQTVNNKTTKECIIEIYKCINLEHLRDQINLEGGCYIVGSRV